MKRPDVFTELEAAAVGCIALEGTCIRSAYVHDLYVLICDYKGVTVYVVVPDSFNRYAVWRRVLGHQLRFIPTAVSAADGAAIATPTLSSLVRFEEASPQVGLRSLGGSVSRPTAAP